jgi:hypothetical protein
MKEPISSPTSDGIELIIAWRDPRIAWMRHESQVTF